MFSARAKALAALFLILAALAVAMTRIGPAETLDKKFRYSAAAAARLLEDLGGEGRARYLRSERLDLAFLLVYTAFAYLAMGAIWEEKTSAQALRRWRAVAFLPGLFDLAETSLVLRTLSDYPGDLSRRLAWLCWLTPAKWSAAAVLAALALYGAVSSGPKNRGWSALPGASGPS